MTSTSSAPGAEKGSHGEENASSNSFLFSRATMAVTLIRIGLLVPREWLPISESSSSTTSTIGWLLHSPEMAPFWTSTLIRPQETWNHIEEARSIRHLFGDQFRDAYRGSYVHVPPLVLAALEPILDVFPSKPLHSFVVGMAAHLVDLAIAATLLQLGTLVLHQLRDPWEDALQARVPESLRPPLEHASPISPEKVVYTNELPPRIGPKKEEEQQQQSTETTQETTQEQEESSNKEPPMFDWSELPLLAAQLYYYSPFTALASGLGSTHRSFQNLWLLLLLLSFHTVCQKPSSLPLSAFFLALASYSELHYIVYLIPLSFWIQRRADSSGQSKSIACKFIVFVFFWSAFEVRHNTC